MDNSVSNVFSSCDSVMCLFKEIESRDNGYGNRCLPKIGMNMSNAKVRSVKDAKSSDENDAACVTVQTYEELLRSSEQFKSSYQ